MSLPRRRHLVIVQPSLPSYRIAFFERLSTELSIADISLTVVYGSAPAAAESVASPPDWSIAVRTRNIRVGRRWIRKYSLPGEVKTADAVIVECASGALNSSELLLRRRQRIGVWGHI